MSQSAYESGMIDIRVGVFNCTIFMYAAWKPRPLSLSCAPSPFVTVNGECLEFIRVKQNLFMYFTHNNEPDQDKNKENYNKVPNIRNNISLQIIVTDIFKQHGVLW